MSLLSAPLPPTLAQNPSHPFSYHHLLPPTSLATLTAIIHPGTPTHRKTIQAKICLIGSSPLIFYLLITPNTTPYYTVPLETVLLKPGGLLKSQMPSQNAERHLQRHTVPKKTASTISPLPDIPPL